MKPLTRSNPPKTGVQQVEVRDYGPRHSAATRRDWVVVEEPLEIRLSGDTLAVTMRTPGHDHELCAGLLLSEGLIESAAELGSIRHCRDRQDDPSNVIEVDPAPGTVLDLDIAERGAPYLRSSSCGLCGRMQIDDLLARLKPIEDDFTVDRRLVHQKTRELGDAQPNFSATGGVHAAGVLDAEGQWLAVREDVGRHNAVDKAIGRLLLDGVLPGGPQGTRARALIVSGRVSFEIVQKALSARLALVIGVSAPSSLAVETARRAGLTLVGFSREDSFNVYAGHQRLI
jgi:FdhD protein